MPNNPFTPVPFNPTPGTAPWELGPTLYVPRYTGHDQTATINTAAAPPPMETGPIAAVGMSKIS